MDKIDNIAKLCKESKRDFQKTIRFLEAKDLLKMSDASFKELNRELRKLPHPERKRFINNIITDMIPFKLHLNGFKTRDIDKICRQILVNWNLIIEENYDISVKKLIDNAIKCIERKEKELKNIAQKKEIKRENVRKKIVGIMRLMTSLGIITVDTKLLALQYSGIDSVTMGDSINSVIPFKIQPAKYVFFSSYWSAATLFYDGVSNIFD